MKRSTLLKMAFVFSAMFLFSGAFAQTTVTVINFDGTAAAAPTLHTITAGVESAAIGTPASNVITVGAPGLTNGTTYVVYNDAAKTQRTTFIWFTADGNVTVRTHTIAFSQNADYKQSAQDVYQTAGSTFRLFADPDPIYNPSYAGSGAIDAAARWTWTYPAALETAPATGTPASAASVNINYVEFTNPPVGSYDITVVEKSTAVSCFDNGQSIRVNVIAAPTAVVTTLNPAAACGDQAAATVEIKFTESVPASLAGYAFSVQQTVDNLSDLAATTVTNIPALTNATFVDYPLLTKCKMGNGLTGAAAAVLTGTESSPFYTTFTTSALTVQNNKITRYTYTLKKASTAAGADGIISAISQKSEYVKGAPFTTYVFGSGADGADAVYVAIVMPKPQTGPVYFIPNNYAY